MAIVGCVLMAYNGAVRALLHQRSHTQPPEAESILAFRRAKKRQICPVLSYNYLFKYPRRKLH